MSVVGGRCGLLGIAMGLAVACVGDQQVAGPWLVDKVIGPMEGDDCPEDPTGVDPQPLGLDVVFDQEADAWHAELGGLKTGPCVRAGPGWRCEAAETRHTVLNTTIVRTLAANIFVRASGNARATLETRVNCEGPGCATVERLNPGPMNCTWRRRVRARWTYNNPTRPLATVTPPVTVWWWDSDEPMLSWEVATLSTELAGMAWEDGPCSSDPGACAAVVDASGLGSDEVEWDTTEASSRLRFHHPTGFEAGEHAVWLRRRTPGGLAVFSGIAGGAFEVGRWGVDSGVRSEDVIGRWVSDWLWTNLLLELVQDAFLAEGLDIDVDETGALRGTVVVMPKETAAWCALAEVGVDLDDRGMLTWAQGEYLHPGRGEEGIFYDGELRLGFAAGGEQAAVQRLSILYDSQAIHEVLAPEDVLCPSGLVGECEACPGDDDRWCLPFSASAGRLTRGPLPSEPPPPCEWRAFPVDLSGVGGIGSFDGPWCSVLGGLGFVAPPAWWLVGLLVRRRR